jgi:putative nucleotidyltransferase with HDIG domain
MKQKITLEIAKELCSRFLGKIPDLEMRETKTLHSKLVGEMAVILAKNKKIDHDLLRIAGYLHDIGYSVDKENHSEHSFKLLENEYEISPVLKDCIINHGKESSPQTAEGKLIQLADRIWVFNQELVIKLLRYNENKIKEKDIEFLKKTSARAIEYFEKTDFG